MRAPFLFSSLNQRFPMLFARSAVVFVLFSAVLACVCAVASPPRALSDRGLLVDLEPALGAGAARAQPPSAVR
jgi:hypothetical protein